MCQGGFWTHCPQQAQGSAHPPGTTPLVAMALMEMAVSKVCGKEGLREQVSGEVLAGGRGPAPARILTQQQQMSTMRSACSTPAVPTIQVSRRKRITPKIFCRQGRYTPMRVPMLGACAAGGVGETESIRGAKMHHRRPQSLSHSAVPKGFYREQVGEVRPGEHRGRVTARMSMLTFLYMKIVWDWEGIKSDSLQNATCRLLSLTSSSRYCPLSFLFSLKLLERGLSQTPTFSPSRPHVTQARI